jgi:hypothetical protein
MGIRGLTTIIKNAASSVELTDLADQAIAACDRGRPLILIIDLSALLFFLQAGDSIHCRTGGGDHRAFDARLSSWARRFTRFGIRLLFVTDPPALTDGSVGKLSTLQVLTLSLSLPLSFFLCLSVCPQTHHHHSPGAQRGAGSWRNSF